MEEHFLEAHSLSLVASEDDQEDHLMMVVEVSLVMEVVWIWVLMEDSISKNPTYKSY